MSAFPTSVIRAALALGLFALAAAATAPALAEDDVNGTKWLEERREERLEEQREQRREESKRDPLVTPGRTRSYSPRNPVAPRSRSMAPGTLPWNSR